MNLKPLLNPKIGNHSAVQVLQDSVLKSEGVTCSFFFFHLISNTGWRL